MMFGNAFAAANTAKKTVNDDNKNKPRRHTKKGRSVTKSTTSSVPTIYENEDGAAKGQKLSPKPPRRRMWGSKASAGSEGTKGNSIESDELKGIINTLGSSHDGVMSGTSSTLDVTNNDDAKSLFSVYVGHECSDNMSILTDGFDDLDLRGGRAAPQIRGEPMIANSLFTFRRAVERDEGNCIWRETTLQAKLWLSSSGIREDDDDEFKEELMSDLVKRLQEMAKSKTSGVLRFSKEVREAMKEGEKRIVFTLPQLKNTNFTKEEFGRMKASDVLGMVRDQPVLVDLLFVE